MLDWTTSFLSDETIIKLKTGSCQILSIGLLGIVEYNRSITISCGQEKKKPRLSTGRDENQPGEATPQSLEFNPLNLIDK